MEFKTLNNGYHVTFPNDWTVSVQWGSGTYSTNYDASISNKEHMTYDRAEIWAFKNDPSKCAYGDPIGYQSSEQIKEYLNKVSKFK